MNTYTIKVQYNDFNKTYTARAFHDNGKQITLVSGNDKDLVLKTLRAELLYVLPFYSEV